MLFLLLLHNEGVEQSILHQVIFDRYHAHDILHVVLRLFFNLSRIFRLEQTRLHSILLVKPWLGRHGGNPSIKLGLVLVHAPHILLVLFA